MKISDQDKDIIEAFVRSEAFNALSRMVSAEVEACKNQLVSGHDWPTVCRFQGRVAGLQSLVNLPRIVAELNENQRSKKADKAEQERLRQARGPRPIV